MERIIENPYLQYFIGLPEYQDVRSFETSTLALFRIRTSSDMLCEANEYFFVLKNDDQSELPERSKGNKGIWGIDATCVPANIRNS